MVTTLDLVNDHRFVQWIIDPNRKLDDYWTAWINEFPQYMSVLEEAKQIVLNLHNAQKEAPNDITALSEDTWSKISDTILNKSVSKKRRYKISYWWAAAAVVLLSLTMSRLFFNTKIDHSLSEVNSDESGYTVRKNLGDNPMIVILPDGSKVSLEPGASLKSKILLIDTLREVFLTGDAFFEIEKDQKRPFIVHSDNIETKVLGTSFWILTPLSNKHYKTVTVKSGVVSVNQKGNNEKNYILKANEQIIYNNQDHQLVKTDASPEIIAKETPHYHTATQFQDIKVTAILDSLSKAYAIEILYSDTELENCRITTSLSSESLYQKLDVLCKAIGAKYQAKNNKLYISGGQCP